jgi:hypothetical protein
MPLINVYYNEKDFKSIEYEYGDETLDWVLKQFDPDVSDADTIVLVDNQIMHDWKISLNIVLCYGPNIRLKKVFKNIEIEFFDRENISNILKTSIDLSKINLKLVGDLKSLINERYDINHNEILIFHQGKELEDGMSELKCVLKSNQIKIPVDASFISNGIHENNNEYRRAKGGIQWSSMETPKVYQWSSKAQEWRKAKPGLCLEGLCKNNTCEAYLQNVIVNMGVPTQFMVGNPDEKKIHCPICEEVVEPVFCAFNRCEWRCVGKRKENGVFQRFNTNWTKVGNEYHRFEDKGTEWSSVCLEVRLNLDLESNINQMRKINPEIEKRISSTSEIDDFFFVAIDYPTSIETTN